MRNAIDRYKDDADKNLIRTEVGSQNYPPDLQTLVDGVDISNAGGGAGGISASALAGASGTSQFGSAGTSHSALRSLVLSAWRIAIRAGRGRGNFAGRIGSGLDYCRTRQARYAICVKFPSIR